MPAIADRLNNVTVSASVAMTQKARDLAAQGIKLDAPIHTLPNTKIKTAFLTDPWGTYIELTEGLERAK